MLPNPKETVIGQNALLRYRSVNDPVVPIIAVKRKNDAPVSFFAEQSV